MMTTRPHSIRRVSSVLACVFLMLSCGGGSSATAPTPAPTPIPTPTPDPTPTPIATSCDPLPPPIRNLKLRIQAKNREYWDVDATPLVGPNAQYCRQIGFTDGRSICSVRPEGDPQRAECEAYAVGIAEDTGVLGPTWTRNGEFCTGPESECAHEPNNLFQVRVYTGGLIKACADNKACGEIFTDKDL